MQTFNLTRIVVCIAVIGTSPLARAQKSTAVLLGTVTDPNGLAVAGAKVAVLRPATGERTESTTNQSGDYRVESLPVGEYEILISQSGFREYARKGMRLEVGKTVRADIALQIGATLERVEVVGSALSLDTETSESSQIVSRTQLDNLPMAQRDFTTLARLVPGVTAIGRLDGNDPRGLMNVRGMRETDNLMFIDGTLFSNTAGRVEFRPNPDAMEEVEIKTGLYSADQGIKPGGKFNIVVRSGTNEAHGSAFWLLRNDNFDARRFFSPIKTEFKRNQFGATFGAPVIIPRLFNGKNRLWFFFAYTGEIIREFRPLTGVVPTERERTGQFAGPVLDPLNNRQPFPNNQIPANRINRVSTLLTPFFPGANTTGPINYTSPTSTYNFDGHENMTKIDFRQSDLSRWSGLFLWNTRPVVSPAVISEFSATEPLRNWVVNLNNTSTWGGRWVNVAGIHYYRRPYILGPTNPKPEAARSLGVADLLITPVDQTSIPAISVQGLVSLSDRAPGYVLQADFQAKEDLSVQIRGHSLKTGVMFRRHYDHWVLASRSSLSFTNRYTGNPWADFLLGYATNSGFGGESNRGRPYFDSLHPYIQDDWKISQRLTLNLGLRYELRFAWRDQAGFSSNFNRATGRLDPPEENLNLQPWQTGRFPADVPLIRSSRLALLPRLGLAWRIEDDTVLRAGYGIFANELDVPNALASNPRTNAARLNFVSPVDRPLISITNPFPSEIASAAVPTINGWEDPWPTSRTHQWGFSLQRSLWQSILLDVGYYGSRSTDQFATTQINDARPGAGNRQLRRPYPNLQNVVFRESAANTWHHGFELLAGSRTRGSLFWQLAFTASKTLDDGGDSRQVNEVYGRTTNLSPALYRGLAATHIGSRLAATVSYDLPVGRGKRYLSRGWLATTVGGWRVQGVATFQTGPWLSSFIPGDVLDTGSGVSQWPDRLRDPNLASDQKIRERWFDTSALQRPGELRYGNAGRSIIQGPGRNVVDLSLHKTLIASERFRLEFRAEAFNASNTANFDAPGNQLGTPSFGVIGSAQDNRQLQFGLRTSF
ncbi:MAG: TonB-dependent receptor [Bryobacteraceae bacterium]|nr:TonB-dependent receptor [Bryobacteraceae bacterium]